MLVARVHLIAIVFILFFREAHLSTTAGPRLIRRRVATVVRHLLVKIAVVIAGILLRN